MVVLNKLDFYKKRTGTSKNCRMSATITFRGIPPGHGNRIPVHRTKNTILFI